MPVLAVTDTVRSVVLTGVDRLGNPASCSASKNGNGMGEAFRLSNMAR
jgi:hypothetical protein